MKKRNRMTIISSYFEGESYGLLGPQMAATIIQKNTSYDCIVIAVTRDDDKSFIKSFLSDYFGKERPVIGFSYLSGRGDLFSFARELKDEESRKIPFELINENPLFSLPDLLNASKERNIRMSQVNLILRADWFLKGEARLRESLRIAGDIGMRILVSSIGFEAFDDTLLANFNKGIDVKY